MKKETVVLGLGNPLMSDEGIGSFLIEKLLTKAHDFPDVEFIDAGTGGMAILHLIEDRKKAILIDCAYMDTKPGTIMKFTPQQVQSVKKLMHYSLHEVDILKVLDIAEKLGNCPSDIVIFGIEPQRVKLSTNLSDKISAKVDHYITAITEELSL